MSWAVWLNLSHVAGVARRGAARAHMRYLLRRTEAERYCGSVPLQQATERWAQIEKDELARRVDARFQSRVILPLPNDVSKAELRQLGGRLAVLYGNVDWSMVIHRGGCNRGGQPENRHAHIVFHTRDRRTGKKDRRFIEKAFRNALAAAVTEALRENREIRTNPPERRRERIHTVTYQAVMRVHARRPKPNTGGVVMDGKTDGNAERAARLLGGQQHFGAMIARAAEGWSHLGMSPDEVISRVTAIMHQAEAPAGDINAGWRAIQAAHEALEAQRDEVRAQYDNVQAQQEISYAWTEIKTAQGEVIAQIATARGIRDIVVAIIGYIRRRAAILTSITSQPGDEDDYDYGGPGQR